MSVTMIVRMTVIITNSAHQDDDKRYNPDVITVTISMIFQMTFKMMIRN